MLYNVVMDLYQQQIIENYKNPHNKGVINDATYIRKQINSSCGDSIEVYIKANNDKIEDVKFIGTGCAISQAAASLLTDKIKNMDLDDVKKLTPQSMYDLLGIEISYGRSRCALLCLNTIQKAIQS